MEHLRIDLLGKPMHLQLSSPTAAALTVWSCLGCSVLCMFPPRTDAAWHVALVTLLGQFMVVSLIGAWRARQAR